MENKITKLTENIPQGTENITDDRVLYGVKCKCGTIENLPKEYYVNIREQKCRKCRVMNDDEWGCGRFDGEERER